MAELPAHRTDDEIAALAKDFVANLVVSIEDIPEDLIPMVFMPLAVGNPFDQYTEEQIQQLFVFAVIGKDHSTNLAINGYPVFFSFQIWHRADAIQAFERAKAAARMLTGDTRA